MPVYEYECTACQHHFEKKQSFSDDAIKICPTCGGTTRRVIFPVGIVFKGSGWYITDSRSSSDKTATIPSSDKQSDEKAGATKSAEKKDTSASSNGVSAPTTASPASSAAK